MYGTLATLAQARGTSGNSGKGEGYLTLWQRWRRRGVHLADEELLGPDLRARPPGLLLPGLHDRLGSELDHIWTDQSDRRDGDAGVEP